MASGLGSVSLYCLHLTFPRIFTVCKIRASSERGREGFHQRIYQERFLDIQFSTKMLSLRGQMLYNSVKFVSF